MTPLSLSFDANTTATARPSERPLGRPSVRHAVGLSVRKLVARGQVSSFTNGWAATKAVAKEGKAVAWMASTAISGSSQVGPSVRPSVNPSGRADRDRTESVVRPSVRRYLG